jgi:hypothetical protein
VTKNCFTSIAIEIYDLLALALWGICLFTLLVLHFAFDDSSHHFAKVMLGVTTFFIGLRISYKWVCESNALSANFLKSNKEAFAFFHSLITLVVLFGLVASLVNKLVLRSQEKFTERRSAFLNNSNEFPFIRDFAKAHFSLDVVLGSMEDAWTLTTLTLNIPGKSPASMNYGPGYCILNMNKENVQASFRPNSVQDFDAFMKGVLIHEFGHCLDVTRDTPNFGQHTYKLNSISPVDIAKVKDAETFHAISQTHNTTLWREVFSDLMTAGYWKTANPARAQSLIEEWRQIRYQEKSDIDHQTSCWLDQIKTVENPKDFGSLRDWADLQRSTFYKKCTTKP